MQRNVVSLNKVVVEMNWQHLGVLDWLLGILRQILVVNVVSCLFSFPVGVFCLRWVRILRLIPVLGGPILRLCRWRLHSCSNYCLLLHLLLLNLLLL